MKLNRTLLFLLTTPEIGLTQGRLRPPIFIGGTSVTKTGPGGAGFTRTGVGACAWVRTDTGAMTIGRRQS